MTAVPGGDTGSSAVGAGAHRAGKGTGDGTGDHEGDGSRIDALLSSVRSGLDRLTAAEAALAQRDGALLVDIRYAELRERDGTIPGALIVERNELEWRLDPTCPHRSPRAPEASDTAAHIVVICNEGYASSLAARSLHELGIARATDLDGGFQAWRAAGLPVTPGADDGPGTQPTEEN